ncbi:hypothetical protein ACP4OV_024986 [Aristida adscensionis]
MAKCGGGKMGGCLGAPVRALSRACGSACDLYVRGMSGCAGRMPSGAAAGAVGRGGLGRPAGASSFLQRSSSDCADDLVRAAARQRRRVAAEPDLVVVDVVGKKKGGAGATLVSVAAPGVTRSSPPRKKGAAAMGTIAEDAPCEFGPDGAGDSVPALRPPNRRAAGFGAMEARRSQVLAR